MDNNNSLESKDEDGAKDDPLCKSDQVAGYFGFRLLAIVFTACQQNNVYLCTREFSKNLKAFSFLKVLYSPLAFGVLSSSHFLQGVGALSLLTTC